MRGFSVPSKVRFPNIPDKEFIRRQDIDTGGRREATTFGPRRLCVFAGFCELVVLRFLALCTDDHIRRGVFLSVGKSAADHRPASEHKMPPEYCRHLNPSSCSIAR